MIQTERRTTSLTNMCETKRIGTVMVFLQFLKVICQSMFAFKRNLQSAVMFSGPKVSTFVTAENVTSFRMVKTGWVCGPGIFSA